jgi:hypothetical protein
MVSTHNRRQLCKTAWVTGWLLLCLWRHHIPPAVYAAVCIAGITGCLCWFVHAVVMAGIGGEHR